jgi:hypothetical protein
MLRELLPNFVGSDAYNRVLAGIEVEWKLEEFNSERTFFQSAARATDRVLYDVSEELPASLAGTKRTALQQTVEFRDYSPLL